MDGGKRYKEQRVVTGGEEAEGAFAVVGMSTAGGGVVIDEGAVEARTSGSEEVSVGGESDEEDWKRWDLRRLAGGGILGCAAAAEEGDAEAGAARVVVARGGTLACPPGVETGKSKEE